PGLLSGAGLAFARALGEFGATLTFAGSRQGVTRTLPLEIYLQRESDADAAVALSVVLVAVAAVVVVGLGARPLRSGAWARRGGPCAGRSTAGGSTSSSRCRPARCWRCWVPTVRGSRRRCTSSRVW